MTTPSDTPRTDSLAQISDNWIAFMQLARQLERENQQLRAMLDAEPSEATMKSAFKSVYYKLNWLGDWTQWSGPLSAIFKAMRDAQREEIAAPNQLDAALCGWKDALMSAAGTNAATKQEAK